MKHNRNRDYSSTISWPVYSFMQSRLAEQIRVRLYCRAMLTACCVGEALLEKMGIPARMAFVTISVGTRPLE